MSREVSPEELLFYARAIYSVWCWQDEHDVCSQGCGCECHLVATADAAAGVEL